MSKLLKFIHAQFLLQNFIRTNPLLIRNDPFEQKFSGVKFTCRLHLSKDQIIELGPSLDYHATPKAKKQRKNASADLIRQIGHIEWLNDALGNPGEHGKLFKRSNFHAEDNWFITHSEQLIKDIIDNIPSAKSAGFDEFPTSFLNFYPRIEFISSTACCRTCQNYLTALRQHLNALSIFIPIIIFARASYGDGVQPYSISQVTLDGQYINTKLSWNKRKPLLLQKSGLSSQSFNEQTRAYLQLEHYGRMILPYLLHDAEFRANVNGEFLRLSRRASSTFKHWLNPFLLRLRAASGEISPEEIQTQLVQYHQEGDLDPQLLDFTNNSDALDEFTSNNLRNLSVRDALWLFTILFLREDSYADLDIMHETSQLSETDFSGSIPPASELTGCPQPPIPRSYDTLPGFQRLQRYQSTVRKTGSKPSPEVPEGVRHLWQLIHVPIESQEIEGQITPDDADEFLQLMSGQPDSTIGMEFPISVSGSVISTPWGNDSNFEAKAKETRHMLDLISKFSGFFCHESSSDAHTCFYNLERQEIPFIPGNCLFDAVASQTPEHPTQDELRTFLARGIHRSGVYSYIMGMLIDEGDEHARTIFRAPQDGGPIQYNTVAEYLGAITQDRAWGREIELFFLSRLLRRPIVLITPGNVNDLIIEEAGYADERPIILYHENRNHFVPYILPEGTEDFSEFMREIRERARPLDLALM